MRYLVRQTLLSRKKACKGFYTFFVIYFHTLFSMDYILLTLYCMIASSYKQSALFFLSLFNFISVTVWRWLLGSILLCIRQLQNLNYKRKLFSSGSDRKTGERTCCLWHIRKLFPMFCWAVCLQGRNLSLAEMPGPSFFQLFWAKFTGSLPANQSAIEAEDWDKLGDASEEAQSEPEDEILDQSAEDFFGLNHSEAITSF